MPGAQADPAATPAGIDVLPADRGWALPCSDRVDQNAPAPAGLRRGRCEGREMSERNDAGMCPELSLQFEGVEIGDGFDDLVGPVGVARQVLGPRAAAEDQDRLVTELHAAQDVGLHRVADDHRLVGGQAKLLAGGPQHHGAGLAHAEGLEAARGLQHGDGRPAARPDAVARRAVGVEIGGDELRAVQDHPQGRLEHLEAHRAAFADHHVVRILVDDGIAVLVQRGQQPPFADDERRAVRLLLGEEPGRRHGAGEDMVLGHVDPEPLERVATSRRVRWLLLVRKRKGMFASRKSIHESIRPGDELASPVDHSIHVDQVS